MNLKLVLRCVVTWIHIILLVILYLECDIVSGFVTYESTIVVTVPK
jgi:hypothetical protein